METINQEATNNISWHPAFVQALQHTLAPYKDVLTFEIEHPLTNEPLRIDVIVIKKEKDVVIKMKIALIFLLYNVIEYKSPDDYLSIDDFYKTYAYVCLYKCLKASTLSANVKKASTLPAKVNKKIDIRELTLTFSTTNYPRAVFKHLEEIRKFKIKKQHNGIYYVVGDIIPIQFIINSELDEDENLFLNSLSKSLTVEKSTSLLNEVKKLDKESQSSMAALLDAVVRGNKKTFLEAMKMNDWEEFAEGLRGTKCAAIWQNEGIEIGIEKGREEGIEKGFESGIEKFAELLDQGYSPAEAKEILRRKPISA
ncbi:hypothetical protein FACS1894102_3470 [Spirochaetia bacterium]|nr:hypothetical protein FACS1894102_3470 [Spirochaetia bacterium]